MRTTLDVDEKIAKTLRELAAASGVSVDQLLATYVRGLRVPSRSAADSESAALAFEEWAASFAQDAPPLSDEAISRASIYPDR
jgi:hypothetical protein